MRSFVKGALLLAVSVLWCVPGFQAWQVLDQIHGLEVAPDAASIRHGLEMLRWTIGAMGAATAVWLLLFLSGRQGRDDLERTQQQMREVQSRLESDVEQLSDVLRRSTAELHGDFGNFTAVGTRLRSALDTRLSGIETLLQQRQQDAPAGSGNEAPQAALVAERLTALENAIEAAMHELSVSVVHQLRGLEANLYERDQRAITDFGSLDSRLADDAMRWESRLRSMEERFIELTRKTTLDGAQVSANLKLLSLRVKDLAQAVQS